VICTSGTGLSIRSIRYIGPALNSEQASTLEKHIAMGLAMGEIYVVTELFADGIKAEVQSPALPGGR